MVKKCSKVKIDFCHEDVYMGKPIVPIYLNNGGRWFVKYYNFDTLQKQLTTLMDLLGADANDSDRDLSLVIEDERYFILERVLGDTLFSQHLPWLEEASKATQYIYEDYWNYPGYDYWLGGDGEEAFFQKTGFKWDEIKCALKTDIQRFKLYDVFSFDDDACGIHVDIRFLTRFSINLRDFYQAGETETAHIVAHDFDVQPDMFSNFEPVYLYISQGDRHRILFLTFSELQTKLTTHMDGLKVLECCAARDLLWVLTNKHYYILDGALEADLIDTPPCLEDTSDALQLLFHRLLDTQGTEYSVEESVSESFAKTAGMTWCDMEASLKRDMEQFGLHDVLRFHVSGHAVVVSDRLLSCFSTK